MSTSGTYSFTVNRDQIIRTAMLNIGKLDESETPTAQQTTDCAMMLNMLIKQWMGKADYAPGLKVWTRRRGHLFLSNSTGTYSVGPTATGWSNTITSPLTTANAVGGASSVSLSSATGVTIGDYIGVELNSGVLYWTTIANIASLVVTLTAPLPAGAAGNSASGSQVFTYTTAAQQPLKIEAVVLRDQQGNDTPIIQLQQKDYDYLPSKAAPLNTGDPTAFYYEFLLTNSALYTDVAGAQDVSKHLVITYLEPVQDVTQASDNFEYPQEYFLALSWGLAKQIAPSFQAAWSSLMQDNYKDAIAIAQHKDAEVITDYFQCGAD